MVLVFARDTNKSVTVELPDNYTITSQELLVRVINKIFKSNYNIDLIDTLIVNENNIFNKLWGNVNSKYISYNNNRVFNTSDLHEKTVFISYSGGDADKYTEKDITTIKNILIDYF
jgi:hypothetical protein